MKFLVPNVFYIMTHPTEVIKHIRKSFPVLKDVHDIASRELCSAIAYQYILSKHNIFKNIEEILSDEPYIGLLGQRDEFESFHNIRFLRLHAILHDAYGRVYTKYKVDRGYVYCMNVCKFLRGCPFLGHITGFWFCLHHKLMY